MLVEINIHRPGMKYKYYGRMLLNRNGGKYRKYFITNNATNSHYMIKY